MAIFTLPIIRREQYDAFRRDLGPDLADTYDEWAKLFADELGKAKRRGDSLVEIEIDYDQFIRYCRTEGQQPNAEILRRFAVKQSTLKR